MVHGEIWELVTLEFYVASYKLQIDIKNTSWLKISELFNYFTSSIIFWRVASLHLDDLCEKLDRQNYDLSYHFHELFKVQVISNLAILRIKVSYNISIILKIQQIILNFEILCNIKNYKNRLGCNLLGFPQTSFVKTFAAKQHRETWTLPIM